MAQYTISLIKSESVANGTMAFHFQKPQDFVFEAGQYVDMTIPSKLDPTDPDNIRSFTISSAPIEKDLFITTRMRPDSPFKNTLKTLQPGDSVDAQGPLGEFTLPKDTQQPAVFLAGGIGVTPFRSMLIQAASQKRQQPITLFYSNRTHADAPFLDEFSNLEQQLPLTFIPVFTQEGGSYIDDKLLASKLPDVILPVYYIAGPPAMVGAMQRLLYQLKVQSDHIRLDEFTGY